MASGTPKRKGAYMVFLLLSDGCIAYSSELCLNWEAPSQLGSQSISWSGNKIKWNEIIFF